MKTKFTFFRTFLVSLICLLITVNLNAQFAVNGEILADTNNVVVVKVWGTHYERGFAHGYLVGDKILDLVQGYLIPKFGSWYPTARSLVTDGQNLVFDSIYHVEAKAMIKGMGYAGFDTTQIDYIDILVGSGFSDLYGYMPSVKSSNEECSTFLNWGDATVGTDLDGKSVITRSYDWGSVIPAIINNAVIIIHVPSEEGHQPWLLVGYAGEMVPSGGGLNQGGISVYKNGLSDFPEGYAEMNAHYEPYQITMRKALEYDDYNGDGLHNTKDVKDALDSNPQGYATAHIISCLARWDPDFDGLTAMIAEITPVAPTHVYRTNSYADSIPGDNLYAANLQIKRNNFRHYCPRYFNMINHMGDGTGIGSEENWNLMKTYSLTGVNYGLMQHIPELDILNLSVYRDGLPAYLQEPTTFPLREFFNRPPEFVAIPDTVITIEEEFIYEITVSDPDPYDLITINAQQLPDWLTLTDNGDGTALLSGVPDTVGVYQVILATSDGMETDTLEFEIFADEQTKILENKTNNFKIYPNPFRDKLFIETEEEAELSIFDISGNRLMQFHLKTSKKEISMSELPQGIYFLQLKTGTEVMTKKVVKL